MDITEVAQWKFPSSIFLLKFGRTSGDATEPVLLGAGYDNKLRIFSLKGIESYNIEWSTDLTSVAIGDFDGDAKFELITGSLSGKLRVVDKSGALRFSTNFSLPIIDNVAFDVDGDSASEFLLSLDGGRFALLDNTGTILWKGRLNGILAGANVLCHQNQYVIVVGTTKGNIAIYSSAGQQITSFSSAAITSLACGIIQGQPLVITAEKNNLVFWSFQGIKVHQITMPDAIKFLTSIQIKEKSYLGVYTTNQVITVFLMLDQQKSDIIISKEHSETDELIKELIFGITSKYQRINLVDIDKIVRESISTSISYNLHDIINDMLNKGEIDGKFEGNAFIRNIRTLDTILVSKIDPDTKNLILGLIKAQGELNLSAIENEYHLRAQLVRKIIFILLGEGKITGEFTQNGKTFKITSDVGNFVDLLEQQFASWETSERKHQGKLD